MGSVPTPLLRSATSMERLLVSSTPTRQQATNRPTPMATRLRSKSTQLTQVLYPHPLCSVSSASLFLILSLSVLYPQPLCSVSSASLFCILSLSVLYPHPLCSLPSSSLFLTLI